MDLPYGETATGAPITDELIAGLAAKAEAGFDVDETLRRRMITEEDRMAELQYIVIKLDEPDTARAKKLARSLRAHLADCSIVTKDLDEDEDPAAYGEHRDG